MTNDLATRLAPLAHDSFDFLVDVGERGDISAKGVEASISALRSEWQLLGA
jgi:hypothetical protein